MNNLCFHWDLNNLNLPVYMLYWLLVFRQYSVKWIIFWLSLMWNVIAVLELLERILYFVIFPHVLVTFQKKNQYSNFEYEYQYDMKLFSYILFYFCCYVQNETKLNKVNAQEFHQIIYLVFILFHIQKNCYFFFLQQS